MRRQVAKQCPCAAGSRRPTQPGVDVRLSPRSSAARPRRSRSGAACAARRSPAVAAPVCGIIDIEGAWRFAHEDLAAEPGRRRSAARRRPTSAWRNHGTAVVGEFGGDRNGFGIIGIAPDANVRAVVDLRRRGLGRRDPSGARTLLSAGDIILIELHRPGPRSTSASRLDQRGYIAIEWWPDDFAAIRYAIAKRRDRRRSGRQRRGEPRRRDLRQPGRRASRRPGRTRSTRPNRELRRGRRRRRRAAAGHARPRSRA